VKIPRIPIGFTVFAVFRAFQALILNCIKKVSLLADDAGG
jgi:hypothetical protein